MNMPITLDPSKQFVSITLYYVEEQSKHGVPVIKFITSKEQMDEWKEKGYRVESDADLKSEKKQIPGMPVEDNGRIIYSIRTKWKRMSWKDQNVIFSRCLKTIPMPEGGARTELDTITYRDMKLKLCLKEWNLKDSSGRDAPVTNDAIDSLEPDIATELINTFERYTEANTGDLGE